MTLNFHFRIHFSIFSFKFTFSKKCRHQKCVVPRSSEPARLSAIASMALDTWSKNLKRFLIDFCCSNGGFSSFLNENHFKNQKLLHH